MKNTLVEEFDNIISEAPLDFIGTGTSDGAIQEEKYFYELVNDFREKLARIDYANYLMENP